jgi:hypothetical protein
MVNGICLQGRQKSALTGKLIKGNAFQLEDGKTCMSQEEAFEWSMCIKYTFLNNGFRMNPY